MAFHHPACMLQFVQYVILPIDTSTSICVTCGMSRPLTVSIKTLATSADTVSKLPLISMASPTISTWSSFSIVTMLKRFDTTSLTGSPSVLPGILRRNVKFQNIFVTDTYLFDKQC